jgi:hypothetical protein
VPRLCCLGIEGASYPVLHAELLIQPIHLALARRVVRPHPFVPPELRCVELLQVDMQILVPQEEPQRLRGEVRRVEETVDADAAAIRALKVGATKPAFDRAA